MHDNPLAKFLRGVSKQKCIKCKFYEGTELIERPLSIIPPPKYVKMMVVIRAPSINSIPLYRFSMSSDESSQRLLLCTHLIVQGLVTKMITMLFEENETSEVDDFYALLFNNTHWSYLQKCPTDQTILKSCARKWLLGEIRAAKRSGMKLLITIGSDTTLWLNQKRNKEFLERNGIETFEFPYQPGVPHKEREGKYMKAFRERVIEIMR